jgi:hypothetical protein
MKLIDMNLYNLKYIQNLNEYSLLNENNSISKFNFYIFKKNWIKTPIIR